jgi:hypothetical protein
VGEIGIHRREFLYDLRFWEVRRIIRGYRNRDRLKHQLLAECTFAAMFAMRDPKGKTPRDIFPSLFPTDDDDATDSAPIDATEVARLRAIMREENARLQQSSKAT